MTLVELEGTQGFDRRGAGAHAPKRRRAPGSRRELVSGPIPLLLAENFLEVG